MSKSQSQLTVALLFGALALLTFFGVAFATGMIDFLYRDAPGLSTFRGIAQAAALLAAVGLFAAGLIITVRAALQPGKWARKVIYVLPLYLLLFTLAGIFSGFIGVGTVGTIFNLQGVGGITFSTAWVTLGAILTTIALVIAAARVNLDNPSLRSATMATGAASVLSVIAVVALLLSVAIVSTNQPSIPSFGPPGGGQRPGGQGAQNGGGQDGQGGQNGGQQPGGQGAQNGGQPPGGQGAPGGNRVATTPEVSSAPPPAVTAEAGQSPESTGEARFQGGQGGQPGQGQGGFPGGQPGGGPPGGGRGFTNTINLYTIGAVLITIFVVIQVGSILVGLRALGGAASTSVPVPATNFGSQVGSVILTFVGITIVGLAVIQLAPVSRENPPVQSSVKWDSPQTEALVARACMDCHSNETQWPWYASIAPSSWLMTIHVHDAREQFNLSELDTLPKFRRAMLFNQMAQQVEMGSMPPKDYLILHPEARLTDTEKQQLIQGLQNSQATP